MQLRGTRGHHSIPDSYLLVGLDETGHETPSSEGHPVFGIGGCAVPVRDYDELIRRPWQALKRDSFDAVSAPLHAAQIKPTPNQLQALGDFFRLQRFARLAALVSTQTILEPDLTPYRLVARQILDGIARLVGRFSCDGVVLIIEESKRTDRLAAAAFSGYHLEIGIPSSGRRPLEMLKFRMPKAAAEPFLEVADFIVHAAGGQTRSSLGGQPWGARRDYQTVFGVSDRTLVEFIEILSATWEPTSDRLSDPPSDPRSSEP